MAEHKKIAIAALAALIAVIGLGIWWLSRAQDETELIISSGSVGGTYNAFAQVLAQTVNGSTDALRVKVVSSQGADENAQRLAAKSADVGFIQSDTAVNRNVTIVARLFPEVFHLIARNDSAIRSVQDLRGKRVALLNKGAGSNALFRRLLDHYNIDKSSVHILHGSLDEGGKALQAGEADALFVVIALGNTKVADIIRNGDVQLIPVEQAEAIALYDPSLRAATIPIGAYSGDTPVPASAITIVAVESLLAVRRDLPDAPVEALTRVLFEKRQNMLRKIPQAAFISEPTETQKLAFDLHPGAESFYNRDKPPFVVQYAEPMAFGMSALVLLLSGIWQGRIWLADRRKNRADRYNLELTELTKRVQAATCKEDLDEVRAELFAIFEQVIEDLDTDKIEEKSLQSFSFAWDVASSTINHKEIVLESRNDTNSG